MQYSLIILCLIVYFVPLASVSDALPPPCSQKELLESSTLAIVGYVEKLDCESPRDSGECKPRASSTPGFKPEMVSRCVAHIRVETTLKGDSEENDIVLVPFLYLDQECVNGTHIIPGSPKKNFKVGSKIKYYNSSTCRFWNTEEIVIPSPSPAEDQEK